MRNIGNQTSLEKLILFLLLAVALLGIALRFQLQFNGLHLDEANYLFVGKQFLSGLDWPTRHYVFSSDLPFYWLAGWDYLLPGYGGRAGALMAGLAAIVAWSALIRNIFDTREVRLIAVFLLLSQPTITSISRLATYDVTSFALFGAGLWACFVAARNETLRWSILSGLLLATAVLTKYVTLLFVPVVFFAWGWRCGRFPWVAATVTVSILSGYALIFRDDLLRLYSEQILVAHSSNSSILELTNIAIFALWPLLLAILWMILATPRLVKSQVFWILLCSAFILVAYHLLVLDRVALYKHLAYSSAFLSILAVWLWRQTRGMGTAGQFFLLLMMCCHLANSFLWNNEFQNAWPDTRKVASTIDVDESTEILSENAYLFRSTFHGVIPNERLHDTTFTDIDRNGDHSEEELISAVRDARFSHVYLDGMTTPALSQRLILGPLKKNYVLVYFDSPKRLSGLDHSGSGLYSALFKRQDRKI